MHARGKNNPNDKRNWCKFRITSQPNQQVHLECIKYRFRYIGVVVQGQSKRVTLCDAGMLNNLR